MNRRLFRSRGLSAQTLAASSLRATNEKTFPENFKADAVAAMERQTDRMFLAPIGATFSPIFNTEAATSDNDWSVKDALAEMVKVSEEHRQRMANVPSIYLMTFKHERLIRASLTTSGNEKDMTVLHLMGIPWESYETQAEVERRAVELAVEGKRTIGIIVDNPPAADKELVCTTTPQT